MKTKEFLKENKNFKLEKKYQIYTLTYHACVHGPNKAANKIFGKIKKYL